MDKVLKIEYLFAIMISYEKPISEIEIDKIKLIKNLDLLKKEGLIKHDIRLDTKQGPLNISNLESVELTPKGNKFLSDNEDLIKEP